MENKQQNIKQPIKVKWSTPDFKIFNKEIIQAGGAGVEGGFGS